MWNIIPDSVKELHTLFKSQGKKLYVVGGAVRDFLNNDKPKDFDLCTDALPDEVLSILGKTYRTNLQGKSFGVVVVYTDDQPEGMEIATFRSDVYDGKLGTTRNPEVKFTTIEEDVLRRDIPFNALFFDLEKRSIIDLVGGIEDINNKITRFVGNPDLRIQEDPLRILRLLRFACRYNFTIEKATKQSIIKNKVSLGIITKERIWDEFKKAFKQAKTFSSYLNYITEFDMWNEIFPASIINKDIIDCKSLIVYISNLFKNDTDLKLEERMVMQYKIEYDISSKSVFLINLLNLNSDNVFDMYKQKVKCHCTDELIKEWYLVNKINDSIFSKFISYKPSVSSQDLMNKGFKGKALGDEIKRLEIENFKKLI